MRKKKRFAKHFIVCNFFLELQCLVNDLVELLELPLLINAFLP